MIGSYNPTQGKIKIENSHVFDMHWLFRTSRTQSLRFTSLNVMTSLNATVMSSRRTTAIEVTVFLKQSTFRSERCARKRFYPRCEG